MVQYVLFALMLGIIAAVAAFEKEAKKSWLNPVIAGAIMFLFFGVANYWLMPTLNFWGFDGLWIEILLAAAFGLLFSALSTDRYGDVELKNVFKMWQAIPLLICVLVGFVRCGSTAECFHAEAYSELLQPKEVSDSAFGYDVHPIPVDRMINVTKKYAEDLASKRIEKIPSLGSRCQFGEADMICLNGTFPVKLAGGQRDTLSFDNEPVYIMPLEHISFWKWRKFETTEGYCIVSAHDASRIYFVTEVDGKPIALRYLRSACFGDEIERHVRTNGYAGYGLTEYSMELDDNGRPYWVITVYEPTIGFDGKDATGCLVVDMQTGTIQEYSIADAPDWIDRIQPDEFQLEQINDWGSYQKGWWNAHVSEDGVRKATPGMSLVYSEGRCYWYSGIQSAGADKASSAFMLIDTRTKECKLYPVAGINEQAAMDALLNQSEYVRTRRLSVNYPVLHCVHGEPSYYMTLTGDGVKNAGYAFVSLKSELLYAVGETPQEALKAYIKVLQDGGQFTITDGEIVAEEEKVEMTVRRVSLIENTIYLTFDELKGKEFSGSTDAFDEIKYVKEGDKVEVSYTDTKAKTISLNYFDIVDFDI